MKTSTLVIGGVVVAGLGYLYFKKNGISLASANLTTMTTKPGYTSMMKIGPQYYNSTSMEGNATATQSSNGVPTPWVMPAEQGDAMTVSAGYGAYGDKYSSTVANAWLQGEAQGAHL